MSPLELKVVYLAMPLSAPTAEGREANRRRACELSAHIAWTERVAVSNTWPMLAEFWSEEQGREFGLKLDCALIARSHEMWMVGPLNVLSSGMKVERDFAHENKIPVIDYRGKYDDHLFNKPLSEQYSGGVPYEHGKAIGNAFVVDDAVNHPKHYTSHPSGVECIDIIEHMTHNAGAAVKYLWRAGLKDIAPLVQDLEKARWYIDREIQRLKAVKP